MIDYTLNPAGMSTIAVEGMEFYAYHGCFPEERIIGTHFLVDVYLEADTSQAETSDDLQKTLNYQEVFALVKAEMDQPSALIETVARRIIDRLMKDFPAATGARVKLAKLNPALGGKVHSASIILSRQRDRSS